MQKLSSLPKDQTHASLQWKLGSPNHWTAAPADTPKGALKREAPGRSQRREGWVGEAEGLLTESSSSCQEGKDGQTEGRTDRRKEGPDVQGLWFSPAGLRETFPDIETACLWIYLRCLTYLCSFQHFPLVKDFHGVYSFSVLHFDNSNLSYKWEFNKNSVNEAQKVSSTFH